MFVQHVVRAATKEYPDAAEIKGCIAIPCKLYKLSPYHYQHSKCKCSWNRAVACPIGGICVVDGVHMPQWEGAVPGGF